MATLLITGGAGYIGSHVAHFLAHNGHNVVILDTLVYGQPYDYPWATCIVGDCGDRATLDEVFGQFTIDAVIHCAASIEVAASVSNPLAFYKNNVATTIGLIEVMMRHGVTKLIFSSSCAVYGTPESNILTETHPRKPISPYGMTKYIVEALMEDMQRSSKLSYVIFRFFNAAGSCATSDLGERHVPETHLIPGVLEAAHAQRPFKLYGCHRPTHDGSCVRDFVHVHDIARAHELALVYLQAGHASNVFNLGSGRGYSVKEIVRTVEEVTGTPITLLVEDDRPGDPHILVADARRANSVLGWYPSCSDIETIIASAYTFFCKTHGKKSHTNTAGQHQRQAS